MRSVTRCSGRCSRRRSAGAVVDVAELLLSERITVRPGSPYNWLKKGQLERERGAGEEAARSERRAQELVSAAALQTDIGLRPIPPGP